MADLRKRLESWKTPEWPSHVLKWIGFGCVCMGTLSVGVLQRVVIDLEAYTNQTLYEAIAPGGGMMGIATLAVLTQLFSYAAIPIYAWLLWEGWKHTSNQLKYLGRLALLALIAEIPFDFAMTGSLLDMTKQNPVWALAMAGVMLLLYGYCRQPGAAGVALKVLVTLGAAAWTVVLQSYMGMVTVLLVAVFCCFEKHPKLRTALAVLVSMIQFPAPLGMFPVHWYNGEREEDTHKYLHYILYPVQLLVFGILAAVL